MTSSDFIALILGASQQELSHVSECLSPWRVVTGDLANGSDGDSLPGRPGLIVVYAQKAEKETLAICERLRGAPETSSTPILLVIGRYQIAQAHDVKRRGYAGFIMTPFDNEQICNRTEECFGISPARSSESPNVSPFPGDAKQQDENVP